SRTAFEKQWHAEIGTGFSSIAVSNGRVLTAGNIDDKDIIWCLDARDGAVIWKHEYAAPLDPNLFEGGPTATPTVGDGHVYAISRRGDVFCLDVNTGEPRWTFQVVEKLRLNVPSWGFSGSPLLIDNRVVLNVGSHG